MPLIIDVFLNCTLVPQQPSGKKLALVIGNGNYSKHQNKLQYSVEDTFAIADLLSNIDFNVTQYSNVGQSMMKKIVDFTSSINDGDLVLFYYCGHGYQVNGKNFLIPVDDDQIESDIEIEDICVNVRSILKRLVERNQSNATIFIADCSRPYFLKDGPSVQRK